MKQKKADVMGLRKSPRGVKPYPHNPSYTPLSTPSFLSKIPPLIHLQTPLKRSPPLVTTQMWSLWSQSTAGLKLFQEQLSFQITVCDGNWREKRFMIHWFSVWGGGRGAKDEGKGKREKKKDGGGRERGREGKGVKKRNPSLGTHTYTHTHTHSHRLSVQRKAQKKPVTPPDSF